MVSRNQFLVLLTNKKVDTEKAQSWQQSIEWEWHNAFFVTRDWPQPPSVEAFLCAISKCKQERSLTHAARLLIYIHECGLEAHETVGNYLVPLLVEVGSLCDAQKIFIRLGLRNKYSWNALIAGFVRHGDPQHALTLYRRMQEDILHPSGFTYVALLKACADLKDVTKGIEVHDEVARIGLHRDLFVGSSLVDMYVKCGLLVNAQEVFDNLQEKDAITWNALIGGYCKQGLCHKAFDCYKDMQKQRIVPSSVTFVCVLKACTASETIEEGQNIHSEVVGRGFLERDLDVAHELIEMYANCGFFAEAEEIGRKLAFHDAQSWAALVSGYCRHRLFWEALRCFEYMLSEGLAPSVVAFINALKAVGILTVTDRGQEIHADIAKKGLLENNLVGTALVGMYSNCGLVTEAQKVFDNLLARDVVSWTSLIAGYSKYGRVKEAANCLTCMEEENIPPDVVSLNALIEGLVKHGPETEALAYFQKMCSMRICPDIVTFVYTLKACGMIGAYGIGQDFHMDITKMGLFESDAVVGNALADFYATSGCLAEALLVFNRLLVQDVVAWTSLMAGYTKYGRGYEALNLFEQMHLLCVAPSSVTYVCSLKACSNMRATKKGQEVHNEIERRGFVDHDVVGNALVDMYASCGLLMEAEDVFDKLAAKDIISWTALLAGYAKHGHSEEALSCFEQMKSVGISPDVVVWSALIAGYAMNDRGEEALVCLEDMKRAGVPLDAVTYASSLKACGCVRAIDKGQEIHSEIARKGFLERDFVVGNALIDMYATCGLLFEAQITFDKLPIRDAVSWTSLIAGYTKHGYGEEALNCFEKMEMEGFSPDVVTFICTLKACGIMGAIDRGKELHELIIRNGALERDVLVGNALLDMYIDCGLLTKAHEVFDKLPVRDSVAWTALIAGYAKHGCSDQALGCFERMQLIGISPDASSWNALAAGYARQGESEVVFHAFDKMSREGMDPSVDTFISILTACSHAGLVDAGQAYFQVMLKGSTVTTTIEHHVCLVDLFARAGQLGNAVALIEQMPYHPHLVILHTILGACRKWGDVDIGRQVFEYALLLDDRDAGVYVCMSNIYADVGMQDDARKVDALRVTKLAWEPAKHSRMSCEQLLLLSVRMQES